jgi:hypothetical protein
MAAHARLRYPLRVRCLALLVLALLGCSPAVPYAPAPDGSVRPDGAAVPIGGGGGGGGGTVECRGRVLVVFDQSASMAEPWVGRMPRWRIAADAVLEALAPLADRFEVGAILFPSTVNEAPDRVCDAVDPVSAQLPFTDGAAFLAAWRERWTRADLLFGTPIDTAFAAADASLPSDGVVTAVLLVTDGDPTCDGRTSAETFAENWAARDVPTFVVGLPGGRGSDVLAAIASAGGTGAPIEPADAASLAASLVGILGLVADQACVE